MKTGSLSSADLGYALGASASVSTSASQASATESATSSAAASSTVIPSNNNIVTIAVGLAVPLGVLLIAALIACGVLVAQNRRLRKEKEDLAKQQSPLPPPPPSTYYSDQPVSYGRSSMRSPAPLYEHKAPMTTTNWAPYTPQSQALQPHVDPNNSHSPPPVAAYHIFPPSQTSEHVVESGGTHVGELPAEEISKPAVYH